MALRANTAAYTYRLYPTRGSAPHPTAVKIKVSPFPPQRRERDCKPPGTLPTT
ncbi:hypothetical protein GGTG_09508 [Gaeumannomyces tritici R3-111a-1]|uniref:Uncharacterized protein n=1 Tax=Gaeumannomyces tritici (strain R3-111a-1) TaxID=644352 RepID=J3P7L6_GAET3|nr:hypothetical protein GGTG_09508 [Gaeumannomyces tritici R3-111a-1]EJT72648.1 hypothetical protein GGTG_09508 [Gaeumannomyces tritici R3-111a-1]